MNDKGDKVIELASVYVGGKSGEVKRGVYQGGLSFCIWGIST